MPRRIVYSTDLNLVSDPFEGLKERLESWKGVLQRKRLKIDLGIPKG